jgi:hypothetical protein
MTIRGQSKASINTELLSSALYFFMQKSTMASALKKTQDLGWFCLEINVNYLDSLLINPSLINKEEKGVLKQYFLLKKYCKNTERYKKRRMENHRTRLNRKSYKVGDSATAIAQIEHVFYYQ